MTPQVFELKTEVLKDTNQLPEQDKEGKLVTPKPTIRVTDSEDEQEVLQVAEPALDILVD